VVPDTGVHRIEAASTKQATIRALSKESMNDSSTSTASVCAVIVTYHPGAELTRNATLLRSQVGAIVIVDNGSSGESADRINELQGQIECTVIRNGKNEGIAAALNAGFRFAIESQYEWIVAFDQDSTVTEGFIEALLDTARSASEVGIVCPTYRDRSSLTDMVMPRRSWGELLTAMTSGSMLHRSTFQRAGPFDERLFIDSVDNEYCLRIYSMGLRVVQSERAILLHSLGRITFKRFMGRKLAATNHSAARCYYIARNRLFLLSRHPTDFSWIRFSVQEMFRELAAILLVEKHKAAKIRMMIRGVIDCARGKWGPQVPL
jgi:rhamnosyltransferase